MRRCIELAALGAGNVAPNPMVGAVLVYNNKIIGEGYHKKFGEAHAEVNCINSVLESNREFIKKSSLYVSLEPCAHFGKTPPCVDLIIHYNIQHVVIGCRDTFEKVNGAGIIKLIAAGIEVNIGILEKECRDLNKRFFTFYNKKRPYIILKWAQSLDGFIAGDHSSATKISNNYTDKIVHKWRSQETAILVGANTVTIDNPHLTTRKWIGKNPVRVIIDEHLTLNENANVFDAEADTIIINKEKNFSSDNNEFYPISADKTAIETTLQRLYKRQLNSVIIEGGCRTLQSFIDAGMWDEARVITNTHLFLNEGLSSPKLSNQKFHSSYNILTDRIDFFQNNQHDAL